VSPTVFTDSVFTNSATDASYHVASRQPASTLCF